MTISSLWLDVAAASHTTKEGSIYISGNIPYSYTYISNEWTLGWFFVDGKYLLGDTGLVRPFLLGEVGGGSLVGDSQNSISGLALGGGGGVEYFFAEHWSLNGMGIIRYSHFTHATLKGTSAGLQNSLSEVAITINGGISFHF